MEKLFKLFAVLFALAMFASCENVSLDKPEVDKEVTQDNAFASKMIGDVFKVINESVSTKKANLECGTYIYTPATGATQGSLVVTYPEEGCISDGFLKAGVLNVSFDKVWTVGATATIAFADYKVDNVAMNGAVSIKYASSNPRTFTVVSTGMTLTFSNGVFAWGGTDTFTEKEASQAGEAALWMVSGKIAGTTRASVPFTREATDLASSSDCKWYTQGSITLTVGEEDDSDVYKVTFSEPCGTANVEFRGINTTLTFN